MTSQHRALAAGGWRKLSFLEQMANIGSEIERSIMWRQKGNHDYGHKAFDRALELIDLTIEDPGNKTRLREIVRAREALVDHFVFCNDYSTTDQLWHNYFFGFACAARTRRG